jgi:hypothetical protein
MRVFFKIVRKVTPRRRTNGEERSVYSVFKREHAEILTQTYLWHQRLVFVRLSWLYLTLCFVRCLIIGLFQTSNTHLPLFRDGTITINH